MEEQYIETSIKLDNSDIDLCKSIIELLKSPDLESRQLAKSLFKTSNFYKENKVSELYFFYCGAWVNIEYLCSDSYAFSPGNFYYEMFSLFVSAPLVNLPLTIYTTVIYES